MKMRRNWNSRVENHRMLPTVGHLMQRPDSLERPWCWNDWGQEKGVTEDEMVGWHHWLNGCEFEHTLGVSEVPGMLQFMGSQRVGHDLETEQQQQKDLSMLIYNVIQIIYYLFLIQISNSSLSRTNDNIWICMV